jgi:hypothetical protein
MSSDIESNDWPNGLEPRQVAFLESYSRTGTVLRAAEGVCHRCSHYRWLEESATYCQAFEIAKALFGEHLREVAIKRALEGTEEPVICRGKLLRDEEGKIVTRRRYNVSLLKTLILWAGKTWNDFLKFVSPGSNATRRDTLDHANSKPARPPKGPTIGGPVGQQVKVGNRVGYAID